ncbi:MAG: hypothetical protein NTX33_04710 [Propionibacteriales bacterium]|nr:hypothetical protein [Propionibacteriales bacterium]
MILNEGVYIHAGHIDPPPAHLPACERCERALDPEDPDPVDRTTCDCVEVWAEVDSALAYATELEGEVENLKQHQAHLAEAFAVQCVQIVWWRQRVSDLTAMLANPEPPVVTPPQ